MELKKETAALYLDTIIRLEKTQFLLEHLSNKIKFDDDETTSFDLEVCHSQLVLLINNPVFSSYGIEVYNPESDEPTHERNLPLLCEKFKILLEGLKSDMDDYLTKSLSF